ncbi:MAG: hypothetical protein EBX44_10960, partial [Betaproteobacteria bacterium]|nr:hypothetical protein [Betaproteobacteria bacterium]
MKARLPWQAARYLGLTLLLGLSGCGWLQPCGEKNEAFDVFFGSDRYSTATYALKLGEAADIRSTITPESCRNDISFAVVGGSLPPGLKLDSGNLQGTPTLEGEYRFSLMIKKVEGYSSSFAVSSNPVVIRVGQNLVNTAGKCGRDVEVFDLFFGGSKGTSFLADLRVGQSVDLQSKVVPESCRQAMTFSVLGGVLPDGLSLSEGNIKGK